ncbi:hypothetical protein [Herbaspirillum autotrophicum]|uniref:hypothetical protein n=1 Tax=Herbaspirillum autotrophicum TaxID=180195 RepID=UPI00067AE0F0|nr:hypothetical protein [Herbaspirillum autotrophicum]
MHIESGLEFSLVFRGHSFAVIVDDEPMAKRFAGTGTHVHPKKIARQSLRPPAEPLRGFVPPDLAQVAFERWSGHEGGWKQE